jgi:PEGA domain
MFNRTRPALLPRFIAAVTTSALISASVTPAFAADPVPAAPADKKAAPAKAEAAPTTTPSTAAAPQPAKPADKPKPADKKTKDAARKAFSEGEKAFAAGDFVAAHTAFGQAHGLVPSAQASYWAAKSLDSQGKLEESIAAYEAVLTDAELDKLGDDKIAEVKARIVELKAKLVGELSIVTTPTGATVSIDGAPQAGETPLTVKLAPGPHKITVLANGFEPKEVDVEIKGGGKSEQKLQLTAKAPPPPPPEPVVEAPPPPPPPPPPPRSKVPAFITLGIAGAGAIVGTIFGVKALGAKSDFDDSPTSGFADDTERNALIADMAFGVAITLGVTGVVLLTSDDGAAPAAAKRLDKLPKKARLVVAPYASPKGGGAAAQYTF